MKIHFSNPFSKFNLIVLQMMLCLAASAQFRYTQLSPRPYLQNGIGKIYAISDTWIKVHSKEVLPGTSHQFLESKDGGKTWKKDTMRIPATIVEIKVDETWDFVTDQVVFAKGRIDNSVYILKSTDGGKNWNVPPNPLSFILTSFDFFDSQRGFASSNSLFYKTSDGGQTWQIISPQQPGTLYDASQLLATSEISFIFISLSGSIYAVSGTDGTATISLNSPVWSSNFGFHNLVKTNSGKLIAFGGRRFDSSGYTRAESVNNGVSWTSTHLDSSVNANFFFEKVQFSTEEIGFAKHISDGRFFKTTDAGFTWTALSHGIQEFDLSPSGTIWGVSDLYRDGGGIVKSTNAASSFVNTSKPMAEFVGSIAHPDDSTFWVVADSVYRSANKGLNWKAQNLNINKINFLTKDIGYALGTNLNFIQKTTNGGQTWNNVSWGSALAVTGRFSFINKDTGWVEIGNDQFTRTLDGGQSWNTQTGFLSPGQNIRDFGITSFDNLWVIYEDNLSHINVKRSTDGGASWFLTTNDIGGYGYKIFVLDKLNAWIIAGNNLSGIFRTKDGGTTWVYNPILSTANVPANLHFVNSNLGYYLSLYGQLFGTKNGGLSWKSLSNQHLGRNFFISGGVPIAIGGSYGRFFTLDSWTQMGNYQVSGRIVNNVNADCIANAFEPGIGNNILMTSPDNVYSMSASDGTWSIAALDNPGPRTVSQIPGPLSYSNQVQLCPSDNGVLSANLTTTQNYAGDLNFVNSIPNCPDLHVNITHFPMRPCRKSQAIIVIRNTGKATSQQQQLAVRLPGQLTFISSVPLMTWSPLDSAYVGNVPSLAYGESYTFQIIDSVQCNTTGLPGGQLCVKATLSEGSLCLTPSVSWDGADLEVASRCQSGQTKFMLRNKGAAMATTSQYRIYIDSSLVYQAIFQLAANNSMTVTLPANAPAGFVRLVVPQSTSHPFSTFASSETNCVQGLSSSGIFSQSDQSPLMDIECVTVTNAIDPNDKLVYPTGWGTAGNVEPQTEFKYTVRFQNTGTDTAFKVVLVDTLDQDLDIASLQIGNASHPYQFTVSGKGRPVLRWTFDNILLPDSNTNEEKSHGFVSYSIRPKAGLALGTRLENFADIYFDFNDPVRTNTTVNTLWQPTYTPGILDTVFVTASKKTMAERDLTIFPNPTKGKVELNSPKAGWLTLYSTKGDALLKTWIEAGGNILNFTQIHKGLYLAKFQFTEGQMSKKIILE